MRPFAFCAVLAAISAPQVHAQAAISLDRYKLIESSVRNSSSDLNFKHFILQKPTNEKIYCGWIFEEFQENNSTERQYRLFLFMYPSNSNENPSVSIDAPDRYAFNYAAPIMCHKYGYITARVPVGIYAEQFLEQMLKFGLDNNFTLLYK